MSATVVFSALFGGYDEPQPVPEIPGVDFVMFTDDPTLDAPGWDIAVTPGGTRHPRMEAKWYKLLPHRCLPDADRTLWIDANERILDPAAVELALGCVGNAGIALHKHPGRLCIYDEADASLRVAKKYDDQPIAAQVEHYRSEGHPQNWGLWACGTIARVRSDRLDAVMDAWWEENLAWSYQDQLSFPVVMRRSGLRPGEFPHNQLSSPWFEIGRHVRDD